MKKSIYTSYDELPLLLSVKQLVDLMGVSDSSIYELIQEDDFPSLRIGKRRISPSIRRSTTPSCTSRTRASARTPS